MSKRSVPVGVLLDALAAKDRQVAELHEANGRQVAELHAANVLQVAELHAANVRQVRELYDDLMAERVTSSALATEIRLLTAGTSKLTLSPLPHQSLSPSQRSSAGEYSKLYV